jgi:hypothetical protein
MIIDDYTFDEETKIVKSQSSKAKRVSKPKNVKGFITSPLSTSDKKTVDKPTTAKKTVVKKPPQTEK